MNSRMPCRITDDPYYDYSDWEEGEGVYKQPREEDPNCCSEGIVYCFTFVYCNTTISY